MERRKTTSDTEFRFNKKFGQNFIRDKNLLAAIVSDAQVTGGDEVLEIGPGGGALTEELAKVAKQVVAYEIDKKLEPILNEKLMEFTNVKVIFNDILKEETKAIEKCFAGEFKIVANLPYYITTPIIFKFLEETKKVSSITIMVQKEVAKKMMAKPGDAEYGVLSVMVNFYCHVKICRIVGRQMFFPVPNVDSAVVKLDVKKNDYELEFIRKFRNVVKSSFSMRRKTLANNLTKNLGLDRAKVERILTDLGLNLDIRAEMLGQEQFIKLANFL